MPKEHRYFTYILTNPGRSVLYIGVTNNVLKRLHQHQEDAAGLRASFAGKYNCIHLLYFEEFGWIDDAIAREKELKGWTRKRKLDLVRTMNPEFKFLEGDFIGA